MKWFMCCNDTGLQRDWELIRVALRTKPECLSPVMLIDSEDSGKIAALRAIGVRVVKHRVSFAGVLAKVWRERLDVAMGAFLRLDIPLFCEDAFCLYTDCDVMFNAEADFGPLLNSSPYYIAAAPQSDVNDWSFFNSGVMVLNVERMRKVLPPLLPLINGPGQWADFDQQFLNEHWRHKYERLPVEFNWKPYWGINPHARIIHFHGPKPGVEQEHNRELVESMKINGWEHYCKL